MQRGKGKREVRGTKKKEMKEGMGTHWIKPRGERTREWRENIGNGGWKKKKGKVGVFVGRRGIKCQTSIHLSSKNSPGTGKALSDMKY